MLPRHLDAKTVHATPKGLEGPGRPYRQFGLQPQPSARKPSQAKGRAQSADRRFIDLQKSDVGATLLGEQGAYAQSSGSNDANVRIGHHVWMSRPVGLPHIVAESCEATARPPGFGGFGRLMRCSFMVGSTHLRAKTQGGKRE